MSIHDERMIHIHVVYISWACIFYVDALCPLCMYVYEDMNMHIENLHVYMLCAYILCAHSLYSMHVRLHRERERESQTLRERKHAYCYRVGDRRKETDKAAAGCDGSYALL